MNVLILAAGYATRLYPLTLNKAKPLLEIAGKPMIEWLFDHLASVPDLKSIFIVTNDKFANDFQRWANQYDAQRPRNNRGSRTFSESQLTVKIINDRSKSDEDKLGAIGDINFVLTREDLAQNDLLVIAGDNLFSEALTNFVDFARTKEATVA